MANSNKEEKANRVKAEFKDSEFKAADETGFKRVPININDPENQSKLVDLNWYLGIANPVYKEQTLKLEKLVKDKTVAHEVKKNVFDHFEFPKVAGDEFEDWLKKSFGENVKVDPQTKEVYTLESDNAPAPEPQPQNTTEETQPNNPTDPDNN